MASSEKKNPWYCVARVVARITTILCPIRYHGLENTKQDGAFILLANHHSMLDPLAVAVPFKQEIRFMGKKELGKNPILHVMFNGLKMIPVDRHHFDMAAMRRSLQELKNGHVLGIFPEGTRHHKQVMDGLETGVAVLALRARAKLLPCYISRQIRWFRRTDIYFGELIPTGDVYAMDADAGTSELLLERIRQTFYDLRDRCGEETGKKQKNFQGEKE